MRGRGRGRPRSERPMQDTGTPELVAKRALGVTAEALDMCLERGLISTSQHWCGIHLRWLYTLRFGAPGVRAVDPTHFGGIDVRPEDPEWRSLREEEYDESVRRLGPRYAPPLLSLAVFNERPAFLGISGPRQWEAMERVQQGFALLEGMWCRSPQARQRP